MGNKGLFAEYKARKLFGNKQFEELKELFVNRFDCLCQDNDEKSKFNVDNKLYNLRKLKKELWIETLLQVLGTSLVVVSIYRKELYPFNQLMNACIIGGLITFLSSLTKIASKKNYKHLKDEFVGYVSKKLKVKNNMEDVNDNEFNKNVSVAYNSACEEIIKSNMENI